MSEVSAPAVSSLADWSERGLPDEPKPQQPKPSAPASETAGTKLSPMPPIEPLPEMPPSTRESAAPLVVWCLLGLAMLVLLLGRCRRE